MGRMGWLDGRRDIYRRNVLGALYWFSLNHAIARGHARLNLGLVPSYLEDGLFAYKEKWLGQLDLQANRQKSWRVLADPTHPLCRRFFARRSLLSKNPVTHRFDVVSNRHFDEVSSARKQAERLGRWLAPEQVWPRLD